MAVKKGICMYCGFEKMVAPVEAWGGEGVTRWYCEEHYYDARHQEEKDKQGFIEYYSDPVKRNWLSPKNLELYNRLTKKNPTP
jgi:hypothetical protein